MQRDLKYEQENLVNDDEYYNCVKCNNYKVCNELLPQGWFDVRNKYLCIKCDIRFGDALYKCNGDGYLVFKQKIDCPVCNTKKCEGVKYKNCDDYICTKCYRNAWFGIDMKELNFPYPDIYKDYLNYQELVDDYGDDFEEYEEYQKKWKLYPLIELYEQTLKRYEEEKQKADDFYCKYRYCVKCDKKTCKTQCVYSNQ